MADEIDQEKLLATLRDGIYGLLGDAIHSEDLDKKREELMHRIRKSKLESTQKKQLKKLTEEYFERAEEWKQALRKGRKGVREWGGDTKVGDTPTTQPGVIEMVRKTKTIEKREYMHGEITDSRPVRAWKDFLGNMDKKLHSIPLIHSEFHKDFVTNEEWETTLKMAFKEDGGVSITGGPFSDAELDTIVNKYKDYCQTEPGRWEQPRISGFSPEIRFKLAQKFINAGFTLMDENGKPTVEEGDIPKKWRWFTGEKVTPRIENLRAQAGGAPDIHTYIRRTQHLIKSPVPTGDSAVGELLKARQQRKEAMEAAKRQRRTAALELEKQKQQAAALRPSPTRPTGA